jgi:enterochelin esterase-like enzyme
VTRDPQKSIVGGYSFGGLAAAFVAFRRPDLFGNVLSQSGAFWRGNDKDVKWEWLIGQYEAAPKLPLILLGGGPAGRRFAGRANAAGGEPTPGNGPQAKTIRCRLSRGTHEPVHWRGEFAEGLISLTK